MLRVSGKKAELILDPAAFPRELARGCILPGSSEGHVIPDPFGGSGTTGVVANELHRKAIIIELNPTCAEMALSRGLSIQPQFQSFVSED